MDISPKKTNGQHVYKKMLDIINYQNHNEVSPHAYMPIRMATINKTKQS